MYCVSGFVIIDSRFPYEYTGGHVAGAHNLWKLEHTFNAFFTHPIVPIHKSRKTAIIFHCEFSSHRAPTQCVNLRSPRQNFSIGAQVDNCFADQLTETSLAERICCSLNFMLCKGGIRPSSSSFHSTVRPRPIWSVCSHRVLPLSCDVTRDIAEKNVCVRACVCA